MADPWNEATGIASLVASAAYAYVAYRLSRRPVSPASALAATQFNLWWSGLSATAFLGGAMTLIAAAGGLGLALGETVYLLMILLDVAILWGLVGYLTYVYTGRYYLLPLSAFYALFYIALLYFEIVQVPNAATVRAGSITLTYAHPLTGGPLVAFVVLALVIPEFAAAFAYLSLVRSTRDPTQRYRIGLVGVSILLWFSVALFTPSSPAVWGLIRSLLEIGAALLTLLAYLPPRWVQERFGVRQVPEGSSSSGPAPAT